jgi:hypothetical protein
MNKIWHLHEEDEKNIIRHVKPDENCTVSTCFPRKANLKYKGREKAYLSKHVA